MNTIDPFVLFDDATAETATLLQGFDHHQAVLPEQIDELDTLLRQGWKKGLHAAIFIPYEFGVAGQLRQDIAPLHIHWFSKTVTLTGSHIDQWLSREAARHDPDNQPAGLCNRQLTPDFERYQQQFDNLQQAIARGDFYQINYTARQTFDTFGSPINLYRRLRARQPVPYGVLAWLPGEASEFESGVASDIDSGIESAAAPEFASHVASGTASGPTMNPWTLCLSPELFIRIEKDGLILAEPMKGTLPFNEGDDLALLGKQLRNDTKNRAENLMIVDLLRNDLSILAKPGGVRVRELFKVTRFGQVLQMTTPIECHPRAQTSLAQVIEALFPCGSITGAPKLMSMQYIAQAESGARGLYTGSIGYLQPADNPLDAEGCFNVAIRTLTLQPKDNQAMACSGVMGVGGGVVYDSTAESEYDEIHWKSRFLQGLAEGFDLFETMLVENGQCALLENHLQRLLGSARQLGFAVDSTALRQQIREGIAAKPADQRFRTRAVLSADGNCDLQFTVMDVPGTVAGTGKGARAGANDSGVAGVSNAVVGTGAVAVRIAERILPVHDPLRRFKTTWRAHFDNDLHLAMKAGLFDVLYFNRDGYLLEGARSSVFLRHNGAWLTPALSLDILPGVMRAEVIANPGKYLPADRVNEGFITLAMLLEADAIVVSNALRGCTSVVLQAE